MVELFLREEPHGAAVLGPHPGAFANKLTLHESPGCPRFEVV